MPFPNNDLAPVLCNSWNIQFNNTWTHSGTAAAAGGGGGNACG